MRRLAAHYGRFRSDYPEDQLLIVFDIDGTILDMLHMVRHVLLLFDRPRLRLVPRSHCRQRHRPREPGRTAGTSSSADSPRPSSPPIARTRACST